MRFLFLLLTVSSFAQVRLTTLETSKKRCDEDRDYVSCYELSYLYKESSDEALALQYALQACEIELKKSCVDKESLQRMEDFMDNKIKNDLLANQRRIEEQKDKNIPQDKLLAEQKCLSGQASECHSAGVYFQFLAPNIDIKRAAKLYKVGCDKKDKKSCGSFKLVKKGIGQVYYVDP
jgi:hypothetical protein